MKEPTKNTATVYMQRVLTLASYGKGKVSPNPCVGCVIVKNGQVVGEGYHPYFGGPHAEIMALKKAGIKAKGATVFVNLEPCTHWGKTGPCAPALIEAGIAKVVIATHDPNPKVHFRGIRMLRRAGIKVVVGLEGEAAKNINRTYFTWIQKNRPYVILKSAMTLDGKIASYQGKSKWITTPASRRLVHHLRSESDAILIGATTAQCDNPKLTSHGKGPNPLRIVLDPLLRTPSSLRLYNEKKGSTLIVVSKRANRHRIQKFERKGNEVLVLPYKNRTFKIKDLLKILAKRNVTQLLIEGGGTTNWSFLKNRSVDEIYLFIAPKILGGAQAATVVDGQGWPSPKKVPRLSSLVINRFGSDILIHGRF
ncbi:riboflavin biosynthesis protein RibD [bacterium F11]|nr:riboflavin biosynthesis protein RibD [bacterium F11]